MEPPAVTSCSVSHVPGLVSNNQHVNKREMPLEFLQIDPQLSFNAANRHFEDLPENFLDTISPQQSGQSSLSSLNLTGGQHVVSSQLASLSSMGVPGGDRGGYAALVSMPATTHYISSIKMDATEHLSHHNLQLHSNIEKPTFSSGTAGLLSPLQLDGGNRDQNLGIIGMHRSNGRASEMLSGIRRSCPYIKEEISTNDISFQNAQDYDTGFSIQQAAQQELERMANAETPPALSNVEITSSMLASLADDSQASPNQENSHFIVHHMPQQQQSMQQMIQQSHQHRPSHQPQHQQPQQAPGQQHSRQGLMAGSSCSGGSNNKHISSMNKIKMDAALLNNNKELDYPSTSQSDSMVGNNQQLRFGVGPMGPGAGVPRAIYSTTDATDPLNAEIDDDIYIDTKDLCKRVAYELKQHSIPQAIFAERILCRSQGTLSDLLRNPKPWNRLKSGRETFRRMFNWLQQPLHMRLSILDMYKGPMGTSAIAPPTPAQNVRHHSRSAAMSNNDENGHPHPKRPRLVFTDIQKRTLQAIFKETQRPSREMQQTIAEHLCLDMSTVSNFFMNARRRSRNGSTNGGDEPAPYQQIRQITPPPDSPPQRSFSTSVPSVGLQTAQGGGAINARNRPSFKPNQHLGDSLDPHHMQHHQHNDLSSANNHSHHHQHHLSQNQSQQQHHQQHNPIEETVDEVVERSAAYSHFHTMPHRHEGEDHHNQNQQAVPDSPTLQNEHAHHSSLWHASNTEGGQISPNERNLPDSSPRSTASTRSIAVANRTVRVKVERESVRNSPPADPVHGLLLSQRFTPVCSAGSPEKVYSPTDTFAGCDNETTLKNQDFKTANFNHMEVDEIDGTKYEDIDRDEDAADKSVYQQKNDADGDDSANAPTAPGTPVKNAEDELSTGDQNLITDAERQNGEETN